MYKVVKIEISDEIFFEQNLLKTFDKKEAIQFCRKISALNPNTNPDIGFYVKDHLDQFVDINGGTYETV